MCIYLNIYIFLLSCESLRAFFARQIQVLSCTSRLHTEWGTDSRICLRNELVGLDHCCLSVLFYLTACVFVFLIFFVPSGLFPVQFSVKGMKNFCWLVPWV